MTFYACNFSVSSQIWFLFKRFFLCSNEKNSFFLFKCLYVLMKRLKLSVPTCRPEMGKVNSQFSGHDSRSKPAYLCPQMVHSSFNSSHFPPSKHIETHPMFLSFFLNPFPFSSIFLVCLPPTPGQSSSRGMGGLVPLESRNLSQFCVGAPCPLVLYPLWGVYSHQGQLHA